MIQLNISPVIFNEEQHTYHLGDKRLHGITTMLSRQLFPDKYTAVPEHILKKAAERGSAIHNACQFADVTGFPPATIEAQNYLSLREAFTPIANEYTASDEDYFASNIDCVWEKDGEVSLADIKTTASLDDEYLSWQLSVYAYLFELQNPHIKVSHLFGVWLRGDISKLIEVPRKSIEQIITLMECEKRGDIIPLEKDMLITHSAISILIEAKQKADYYTQRYKEIEEKLLGAMVANKVKSWDAGRLKATYTSSGKSSSFDAKKFQSEHPDLYNQYLKTTNRKESIRITIRDNE